MTMTSSAARLKLVPGDRPVVPNLITIASGKGGVGKTWFASTLAHALSYEGASVLLFDGDLGLANIDVQIGLTPERDLAEVISGRISLEEAVTPFQKGAFGTANPEQTEHKIGFDIIAGRSGSGSLGSLSREQLIQLTSGIGRIAKKYDWLIVDLAAGIDNAAKLLSTPSGKILVILTDEPTSLTDAYAYIKIMAMRDPNMPMEVVVNMADSVSEGKRTFETLARACRNFLNFEPKLAGIIHRDDKVKQSIRRQSAILNRYPQAKAAKDVISVAQKIQSSQ